MKRKLKVLAIWFFGLFLAVFCLTSLISINAGKEPLQAALAGFLAAGAPVIVPSLAVDRWLLRWNLLTGVPALDAAVTGLAYLGLFALLFFTVRVVPRKFDHLYCAGIALGTYALRFRAGFVLIISMMATFPRPDEP